MLLLWPRYALLLLGAAIARKVIERTRPATRRTPARPPADDSPYTPGYEN
jgi:hypothetical protein